MSRKLNIVLFSIFICLVGLGFKGFKAETMSDILALAVGKSSAPNTKAVFEVSASNGGLVSMPCPPYATTSLASTVEGGCIYDDTINKWKIYNGSSWAEVGGGAGGIFAGGQNLLTNNSWETDSNNWTASAGTYTRVTGTDGFVPPGVAGGSWDAAAAGNTLTSDSVTINADGGIDTQNIVGTCSFRCNSSTCTHILEIYDGTIALSSTTIISETTRWNRSTINAVSPGSGTIALRIKSAADEPIVYIDDCYLGKAEGYNISAFAQAQLVGKSYIATTANCSGWTRTNTAIGVMASDTDCPGPTIEVQRVGSWQTTDADLPQQTINNLPPGDYIVVANFTSNSGGSNITQFAITDGTTTSGRSSGSDASAAANNPSVMGYFSYAVAGNRTFAIHCSASTSTCGILNNLNNEQVEFIVYRYPLANEQAYTTDNADFGWTAYTPTCNWTTNTTCTGFYRRIGDSAEIKIKVATSGSPNPASSLLTATLPTGLTIDTAKMASTVAGQGPLGFGQVDDTGLPSYRGAVLYSNTSTVELRVDNASSTYLGNTAITSAIPMSWGSGDSMSVQFVVPISGWATTNRAPQLVNSVINDYNGVTRTIVGKMNCDSGSAIASQMGTAFSTIGNIASGACAITFQSGTFSGTPYCTGNITTCSGGCVVGFTGSSSTGTSLNCITDTGSAGTSCDANIICVGPK